MNALPLYMKDAFGHPAGLVIATLLGFAFGFVLERSGFGRASVLAAQFYFTNLRVLKVMFAAIVTALLGMTILSGAGLLDLAAVRVPETFLWPQLVGGLLLGMGFIVSGYCPGTGVVALASGKWDGLVAIFGVMAGSVLFGFAFPLYATFYESGALGSVRLPELLGVSQAWVAVGVALMALGAFVGGEKLERMFGSGASEVEPARDRERDSGLRRAAFGVVAAASAIAALTLLVPEPPAAQAERAYASIDPVALAQRMVEQPDSQWLIDLRPGEGVERIPGSFTVPADDPGATFVRDLPATRDLVLFGEDDLVELPSAASGFPGRVLLLAGGYRAFEEQILATPALPGGIDARGVEEYRLRSALHAHFTGTEAQAAPPPQPRKVQRSSGKKEDGC